MVYLSTTRRFPQEKSNQCNKAHAFTKETNHILNPIEIKNIKFNFY